MNWIIKAGELLMHSPKLRIIKQWCSSTYYDLLGAFLHLVWKAAKNALLRTIAKNTSQWLADSLLTQQLHVDWLLIPLLRAELSSGVTLLQEITHNIELNRLHRCIGCRLVIQLTSRAMPQPTPGSDSACNAPHGLMIHQRSQSFLRYWKSSAGGMSERDQPLKPRSWLN